MGGIRQLWHVWKDLISSLRVDPQEAKKRFVEKWDKEGITGGSVLPQDSQDSGWQTLSTAPGYSVCG